MRGFVLAIKHLVLLTALLCPCSSATYVEGSASSDTSRIASEIIPSSSAATVPAESAAIKPRAYEALLEAIKDPDEDRRYDATMELGHHWPKSKKLLGSLLKDPDELVRVAAAGGMLVRGDHSGEKLIDDLMRLGDHDALLYVAQAIGSQPADLAARTFERIMLDGKKPYVQRVSAAVLLEEFAGEEAVDRARFESSLKRFLKIKTVEELRPELMRQAEKHLH